MRVLVACGASGGHIFPALALGASLKTKMEDVEMLFVGSRRYLDVRIFKKESVRFRCLSSNKLPYGFSAALPQCVVKFLFDIAKSALILNDFRPDVIIGFGGYVSFPIVVVGSVFRIPTVVHEQNARPGRANSVLFRFARKIAVSFEETLRHVPGSLRRRAAVTGNPIRRDMLKNDRETALKEFGFEGGKFTILVIGGSQGAHRLNKLFAESVISMNEEKRRSLQVIHIAGERDRQWVDDLYRSARIQSRVFSFIDRIDEAYSLADLIVSRSGAAALFEIAFYGRPAILVPYPYAMSHQRENALAFSQKGAAIYKEEEQLSSGEFNALISGLMDDRPRLKALSGSIRALSRPDASDALAELVIGMVRCG